MTAEEQWDKDYQLAYDDALAYCGVHEAAAEAAEIYADDAGEVRGHLVLREIGGEWDWDTGAFASDRTFPTQAAAAENFEASIFDLVAGSPSPRSQRPAEVAPGILED